MSMTQAKNDVVYWAAIGSVIATWAVIANLT
jgi:hypothetical protein